MKIVNISGGLGNQMFQFAFALRLKNAFPNEDIFIDTSHYNTWFFKHYKGINLHNGFEIEKVFPNAHLPVAGWRQIMKLSYFIPNYVLSRLGRKLLPQRKTELITPYTKNYSYLQEVFQPGDLYYEGYWQSIQYLEPIKPLLKVVFAHSQPNQFNQDLIEEIRGGHSVGIHVRRGDYLNEPEFKNICDIDYYKKAIARVLNNGKIDAFYLFSNDLKWCEENIAPLLDGNKIVYVTENKGGNSCWDLFLMTYCEDLIIANSTFSWWGAFLNKRNGRVFAPQPWLNRDCEMDLYDESWIRL